MKLVKALGAFAIAAASTTAAFADDAADETTSFLYGPEVTRNLNSFDGEQNAAEARALQLFSFTDHSADAVTAEASTVAREEASNNDAAALERAERIFGGDSDAADATTRLN